MSTPNADSAGDRRWSPEQLIQLGKEIVTALIGLVVVIYTLIVARQTMGLAGDEAKIADAKDVLLLLLGLAGVVVGYYFGRVPADARAAQAQGQANEASARAEKISGDAAVVLAKVDEMLDRKSMRSPEGSQKLGTLGDSEGLLEPLKQVRDELRAMASTGRRR